MGRAYRRSRTAGPVRFPRDSTTVRPPYGSPRRRRPYALRGVSRYGSGSFAGEGLTRDQLARVPAQVLGAEADRRPRTCTDGPMTSSWTRGPVGVTSGALGPPLSTHGAQHLVERLGRAGV